MRIVLQKVSRASVTINPDKSNPETLSFNAKPESERSIGIGFVLLIGVENADTSEDVAWTARKIAAMRVFQDDNDKMNLCIKDVEGSILSISQFTLYADIRKGNRPSFVDAGEPHHAQKIWTMLNNELRDTYNIPVTTGIFGSHMNVQLVNDGPVTILIDTKMMMPLTQPK
ncbi:D-aminoacyl-tRNA deacylase [Alloscardovia venturai]|uniref:D-aminoacyl-tRNA deacylase n=1 Tax=Alloscardovia venturai TaxID=1769421 RepID=A0ABW2Y4G7_9BIFI